MVSSRRLFIVVCVFFIVRAAGFGQAVDEGELRTADRTIIFRNYEGPHARIDSREQIRSIGADLGRAFPGGRTAGPASGRAGSDSRYFVIHSISAGEDAKFNAAIFGLGPDAGVDHIRNLRLIVQGYLQTAWAYSERDAATLAEFITVYNAVYRGNMDYLAAHYRSPVMGYLSREKAGLSTNYAEWPGKTLMLIPLRTGRAGSLSAVDTGSLADRAVIDDMRTRENQGLDTRRDMVDILEREADAAREEAQRQNQEADRRQAEIDQGRESVEAERRQTAEERERLDQQRAAGTVSQAEARRTEEELSRRDAEADRQERELDRQQEETDQAREEAGQNEELADAREEQAQEMRRDIAGDQQGIIARQDSPGQGGGTGVNTVRLLERGSALGQPVKVNPATGAAIRQGGMTTVNARTLTFAGGRLFAIAGENRGNAAIRLVEINADTLEMKAQGDTDIHPQSLLWLGGNDIYAITVNGGQARLGRFNTSLEKQAESAIAVHPFGSPVIQGSTVAIQREDGTVAVLNTADLVERH